MSEAYLHWVGTQIAYYIIEGNIAWAKWALLVQRDSTLYDIRVHYLSQVGIVYTEIAH